MSARFVSTCVLGHKARRSGLLASWRNDRWWRKHRHLETRASCTMIDVWHHPDGDLVTEVRTRGLRHPDPIVEEVPWWAT